MIDKKITSKILKEIKLSENILLHLHPSPDPDSIGSALALQEFLLSLDKKVTIIAGDSKDKNHLEIFPNVKSIKAKNIFETDLSKLDLFIILDSSEPSQISKLGDSQKYIANIKKIVIDHHPTNKNFGDLNLVLPKHTSTAEILFDLFNLWKVKITTNMAICLFLGIYSDTGGFSNLNTTPQSIYKCSILAKNINNLPRVMFEFRNNSSAQELKFIKLGLVNNNILFNNKVAISAITLKDLKKNNLDVESINKVQLSETLRKCKDWQITIAMVETKSNYNTLSMRSRNEKYDLTKIAKRFSGGGHKVAAGALIEASPKEALKQLIAAIHKCFPELGEP
ncbi:bifunctional oligoribonuclease/PAP phosphatase NrnA [Candidatus Shapirobacteria bacterium]|nr:bifunctional oligoribonuclease/PAP phosphatase NrnA [Candidatus Shapirobacteria bacterium]